MQDCEEMGSNGPCSMTWLGILFLDAYYYSYVVEVLKIFCSKYKEIVKRKRLFSLSFTNPLYVVQMLGMSGDRLFLLQRKRGL